MKILLINQCHYKRGGADVVYLNTAKLLEQYGHVVASYSTINDQNEASDYSEYFIPTYDLRNVNIYSKIKSIKPYLYNKNASKKLQTLISDFKPDLAHVHLFYATLSVSILDVLRKNHIPIIHTVHDYRFICPVSACLDNDHNICEDCSIKNPLSCIKKKCSNGKLSQSLIVASEAFYWKKIFHPEKKIDKFHFVSKFAKNKYEKFFPEIKDKSFVLHNFGDIKEISMKNNSEKYYLYFGRLSTEKGILTLLETWGNMPNNPNLIIVGGGPLNSKLNEKIQTNNISNVKILGYKRGKELEEIIQNAYFVIVPSEWYENNPMTIIEAYSLGTPVIGSNVGGIPEIIVKGETGFIFKMKDTNDLTKVIKKSLNLSETDYQKFKEKSYEFAKNNFSSESHYYKLIEQYKDLLKK